ncbi:hypothetical protein DDB_G0274323 [Dictyostelium discoideum AX4]|uniref:Uncharacterized protein n=1 Tax=Dictyostelium discoideum TaxID=44689 RepID=Q86IZ8_DICDI|nr:hypothetical protein DDB_G0274323 [Dictyostelium discoideum AX4]EAL70054.1 hypothetical protein DDB_G0274323 [Dictyostelium discoideum AX4]|eukprot:XP_643948.1 hypothetical protein DDB_G0274323 [Dictyostelium discoideum AX4]
MGQTESPNKNNNNNNNNFSEYVGGNIDNKSQKYGTINNSNQKIIPNEYTHFNNNNNTDNKQQLNNSTGGVTGGSSGSGSISKSTSTNEIITINQLEKKEEYEPELNILFNTPIFYPLLSIDDDDDDEFDQDQSVGNGDDILGDEEKFIKYLKKKHHISIPEMDHRGYLNLCIDIQNYLKNSTGYIHEKQNEILQKIRDVETKQAKKITNIMQIKTSDATHAQFGIKEVMDKVKGNLDKSKEIIHKISFLIEKIESTLPEDEINELKEEMNATFGPLQMI